jgi:transcriptional regulator with XRE-family HTH domain
MSLKQILDSLRGVDLAKSLGVHPVTICLWKRGASFPPRTRIPALAAALGIPAAELAALIDAERQSRRALADDSSRCDTGVVSAGVHGGALSERGQDISDQSGQAGGRS